MKIQASIADRRFNFFVNALMIFILVIVLYPLYFVLIASFSNPDLTYAGKVILFPKDLTTAGYVTILKNKQLWTSYLNTFFYTALGTIINLLLTLPAAFALSRSYFRVRKAINVFVLLTMFFSGGLIPTYLLVKDLGLLNTVWAIVLVPGVSVWNLIIARTFFAGNIPDEIEESAFLDGCSHFRFFISIVLPLSTVIVAVLGLFYGIAHWNGYFNALIYLTNTRKYPLQLFLRGILIQQQTMAMEPGLGADFANRAALIRYAMIVVACGPVLAVYPFLQKFFVKGVLIGSVKG